MKRLLLLALILVAAGPEPVSAAEKLVELRTTRGSTQRMLVDVPANPIGSVVLLAGGTGVLDIDADGRINSLALNQLIRTRAAYVAAGFAVAAPDVASDMKGGRYYLADARYGRDIAGVVAHMRAVKGPVALVATSRSAISAATVMLRQSDALPDALVITSGMLRGEYSAEAMGDPARIKVPVLLVAHRDDTCRVTAPSDMPLYAGKLTGSRKVETLVMTGGEPLRGDPCDTFGPHGFYGLDQQVVNAITAWLKANMR
jgi:hypothetical protein